jgi:hypothetical protein
MARLKTLAARERLARGPPVRSVRRYLTVAMTRS